MMAFIRKMIDELAKVRGIFPLFGLLIVSVSLGANFLDDYWVLATYLTFNQWLLHIGVLTSIIGLMVADAL